MQDPHRRLAEALAISHRTREESMLARMTADRLRTVARHSIDRARRLRDSRAERLRRAPVDQRNHPSDLDVLDGP